MDAENRKGYRHREKYYYLCARHTFLTVLKRSGASTEYIQKALGHRDMKTTQNYLDSFERGIKKEFAGKLTAFKRDAISQTGDIF